MRNFFEVIGIADMEKVHSATIGWMLSDDCDAFDLTTRSRMLNDLFGTDGNKIFKTVNFDLEWENIDIRYETTDVNDVVEYWVIENKIKSSQHNNQLAKYEEIMSDKYPNNSAHYVFLSLIKEKAIKNNWENRCYDDLLAILATCTSKACSTHSVIIAEYTESITKLVGVKNRFLDKHGSYECVFTDGFKSKSDKVLSGVRLESDKYYIAKNQLETILQKLFIQKVLDGLCLEQKEKFACNIHETRGNAACGFYFNINKDKDNSLGLVVADADDKGWESEDRWKKYPIFDFSFQNGTFKIALSKDYNNPTKKNKDEIKRWHSAFEQMKSAGYERVNNGKSRARISLSKQIKINNAPWYSSSKEEIANVLSKEIESALQVIKEIKNIYFANKSYIIES